MALTQSLFATPSVQFATPGATTGTFTPYARLKDYLDTIARTSDAKLYSLLTTAQGREVWALRLGNPQAKVRVMVYSRVHGDEPAASEGALAFLDALTRGELNGRYPDVELVVVPMANPDGAVAMKRATAQGGDINRDFVKYDYPETRAIQSEILRFDPHVVVDAHEFTVWGRLGERTSASDMQSAGPNEPNLPKPLVEAHERLFRTAISRNFAQYGLRHDLSELLSMDKTSGQLRVAESATTFVSAKNYHAMSGRFSFLFETRGIGLGDQHMPRRTLSHYQGMKAIVETAQANAEAIVKIVAEARQALAANTAWELDRKTVRVARQFPLADGASGKLVPLPAEFVQRTAGTPGAVYELGGPDVLTFRELLERTLAYAGRERGFLSLPFWLAKLQALLTWPLPNALRPLTVDQVRLLQADNVVSAAAQAEGRTLAGLGVAAPQSIGAIVPMYLERFRPKGQYSHYRG